jgi:hypothetical protein|tara:strand:- start:1127 stop:1255 length:129 start_codon:yes stop_codon:yes gene_type:complete
MKVIANHFRLLLLVVDERFSGRGKFTRIVPTEAPPNLPPIAP